MTDRDPLRKGSIWKLTHANRRSGVEVGTSPPDDTDGSPDRMVWSVQDQEVYIRPRLTDEKDTNPQHRHFLVQDAKQSSRTRWQFTSQRD